MQTLFLDLASHAGLLACVDDHSVVASQAIDHRIGDHELVPIFERTLQEAGWQIGELMHIACVIGPGGFMSLRVVVAFANTLMHQLRISGVGIHLSDLFGARVNGQQLTVNSYLWLHSTKRNELFVRGFGSLANVWPEAALISLQELEVQSTKYKVRSWAGELIPEHEALVRERGIFPAELRPLEDVLPVFLAHQTFTSKLLEPWYGRAG